MPKVSDLGKSKYLKQTDVGDSPILVTIASWDEVTLEAGGKKEQRYIILFQEPVKPLVMNKTNGNRIAKFTGSDDFDDWIGKKIVIYVDPDVEMGGEIVGGLRVRAPKTKPQDIKAQPSNLSPEKAARLEAFREKMAKPAEKTLEEINEEAQLSSQADIGDNPDDF